MKGKTFLILLVAAGVLVALSFLHFGAKKHSGEIKMGEKLFADLQVNTVASLTIADSENKVTLVKGDTVWQVEERNGYPANFDELRDMVVNLSRLKIGRSFIGSTESLARLSLMAPSASDPSARGKQVTLKDPSGKILADVILGQIRKTDGGGDGGQYLKKADADTVFLVDGNFRFLKTAPSQWLEKEILDVKADQVASVTCYAGDAPTPIYALVRPEKGEAARLTPVLTGRTADPAKIEQVFDALAPLTLDDVRSVAAKPPLEKTDRFRLVYHLYDGRQITILPDFDGKESYTLQVAVAQSKAQTDAAEAIEPATEGGETRGGDSAEQKQAAPVMKTAQELNEQLNPWVFSVKKWQFDSFITQPESLLEEVKKEGQGTS